MGKTRSCSCGQALLSKTLIQLSADGWGCAPSWWLFSLRRPSPGSMGSMVGLMGELQVGLQGGSSWQDAASAPVPALSTCWPTPPQKTLSGVFSSAVLVQLSRKFQFSLLWGHWSFLLGLGVHKTLFVPCKTGVCFPQPYGSLVIESLCPSRSVSLGIPSPFFGSPGWETMEFRTFTTVAELLWFYCSPVCGLPT